MDVTQELKDTENLLRDFIASRLSDKLGQEWTSQCGVSEARIQCWKDRKQTEEKRLVSGQLEERLIYYADFYDLHTILKKHWVHFADVLGEWRVMDVFISEIGKLRDPDAHRRELLPHQKSLIIGIAGEIRTLITRWRSKLETGEDCFPRIDFARDSLGHSYRACASAELPGIVNTGAVLRPGDAVSFSVTATDPLGAPVQYRIARSIERDEWQSDSQFTYRITEKDIARHFYIELHIRSSRDYHARSDFDDKVSFGYTVLPAKREAT